MIEYMMTQTVRVCCDHCGKPGSSYQAAIEDAREEAKGNNFLDLTWKDGPLLRQLTLCPDCEKKVERTLP